MGKFSKVMLFGSIIVGIIYAVLGEFIYNITQQLLPNILVTFIYWMAMFGFFGIAIWLISNLAYSKYPNKIIGKTLVLSLVLMLVLAPLLELFYDMTFSGNMFKKQSSFLFLIDDSGSMTISDPMGQRYDAIESVLNGKKKSFKYGVYSFSDEPKVTREWGPISSGDEVPQNRHPEGGTAIRGTLERVINDIENGDLDIDDSTKVVLLSDGDPTDAYSTDEFDDVLDKYNDLGIAINTVGLAYTNDEYMSYIADETDGIYVNCDDVSSLDESFSKVTQDGENERNLIGFRKVKKLNPLFAILRILFITGLGIILAVQKTSLCEKFVDTKSVLKSSIVCSALAGIVMEVGINILRINPFYVHILACALLAFTLLREDLIGQDYADATSKENNGW